MPALAQSSGSNYQALVCVFLYGGNDSNNMVIPESQYGAYQTIRGTNNLALPTAALKLVSDKASNGYYFHGMMPQIAGLFSSGNLAVAANVGPLVAPIKNKVLTNLPANLFSHADQQAEWQTTDPTELVHPFYGWGGRAAGVVQKGNPNFPTLLSVSGNDIFGLGPTDQIEITPGGNLNLTGFDYTLKQARSAALNNLLTTESGLSLVGAANTKMSQTINDAKALGNALNGITLTTTFPTASGSLGQQLKQVALIMKANTTGSAPLGMTKQIFFCSLGGFDTHTGELEAHNNLYPQMDSAISTFWAALGELGLQNNVVLFTESEFSRTMQPTTTDGSDHAWGSHHLVLGGQVKGQQIYNSFPTFDVHGPDAYDTRGRWIPTAAVDQYGETLIKWFGITTPSDVATVFPNLSNFDTATSPNPLTFL